MQLNLQNNIQLCYNHLMEIQQFFLKNATLENQGVVLWLWVNYKMYINTVECTHCKYACSQ
jgi:N6-adenosine-specific RNA methylase IME4